MFSKPDKSTIRNLRDVMEQKTHDQSYDSGTPQDESSRTSNARPVIQGDPHKFYLNGMLLNKLYRLWIHISNDDSVWTFSYPSFRKL